MYEHVKTVMFGNIKVTIVKNQMGDYFAEYDGKSIREPVPVCNYFAEYDGEPKQERLPVGNDFQFIWERLSEELGGDDAPTGWDLLALADEIETTRLTQSTTYGDICVAVEQHLFEHKRLWPAYIHQELIDVLDCRYGRVEGDANARIKLNSVATIEEWLRDAISSKRIYRLTTTDKECQEHPARIIGAYKHGDDYLLSFEILEICQDEEDRMFWDTPITYLKFMHDCALMHHKTDELPPEYEEVKE
jgi:hypothetical protein